ncbi:DUF262 domain-containing protein [Sphingobacterium sp. xlx-130]|uniref:DUF262 domain-containing protein n=1 Tax=Sphingobacterium sp. xlx-130 TaxID=2654323 RepID=UPI0013DAFBA3|nr:DUF262 domain-containing protein [Sphingobacterium sp. xlx-130]
MKDFIFSVSSIFEPIFFKELETRFYYIAAYQRGYKWKSQHKNDQVPLLLLDTYDAYVQKQNEYYIQYITVKQTLLPGDERIPVLEVIDGQQRLTTISLLYYVAERHLAEKGKEFTYVELFKDKVKYQRHIGVDIFAEILAIEYDSDPRLEKNQDYYYLYQAKKCMQAFLQTLTLDDALNYLTYFSKQVKIIINKESKLTKAEEVFSNLNDNKVELTDEFLIKGLLFTKSTRKESKQSSFKEIQEQRARIAFKWDEIDTWFSIPEHYQFFFVIPGFKGETNDRGLLQLLRLLAPLNQESESHIASLDKFLKNFPQLGSKDYTHKYELFNLYNDRLKKAIDIEKKLIELNNLSNRLQDWYGDNYIHNLLGFYIYTKGELSVIIEKGREELLKHLHNHVLKSITVGDESVENLNYFEDGSKLNVILLALNAFQLKIQDNVVVIDSSYRFNFNEMKSNNWSIEHIYPQKPDVKNIVDFLEYPNWFEKRLSKDKYMFIREEAVRVGQLSDDDEKTILKASRIDVHGIGNLALLEKGANSALSNNIFPSKRRILLDKINRGSFVPKHTIEVISKLLSPVEHHMENDVVQFDSDLLDWNEKDCEANKQWIVNTYTSLVKVLDSKI